MDKLCTHSRTAFSHRNEILTRAHCGQTLKTGEAKEARHILWDLRIWMDRGTLAGTEETQWLSGPCWTGLESDSKWALHNCFCMSSENVWKWMMGAKLYEYTKKKPLGTTTGLCTSKEGMLAVHAAVKLVKLQLNKSRWPWRCGPVVATARTAEAGGSHVWGQPGPSQNKKENRGCG